MARLLLRDLTPGTAYKIQLRAVEGDSVSEWSRLFPLTVSSDAVAPDTPLWAALNDFVVSGDTFVATWQAVDRNLDQNKDLSHYEIEFGDGVKTVTFRTNNTSYTLTFEQNRNLFGSPKATVTARVRAVDAVGNVSAFTDLKTATNPAPSPVNSVSVTQLYDSIDFRWDAGTLPDDFKTFIVQVSLTSASSGFSTVYAGSDPFYTHPSTNYNTDHWFRVLVQDKFGSNSTPVTSTAVRPKSSFTIDATAPDTPTALAATITNNANGIGARASLTWTMTTPPSDLAGFYVRWRRVGDTVWTVNNFQKDDRAGIVELQAAFTNHEFQIKAFDWSNNESAWSATVTATSPANTAPAQVTGLASVAGRDSIRYTWTPSTAADLKEYEVTFSTSATFASGNITFKTGTAAVLDVGGLTPATTYYARVRAIDTSASAGSWSTTDTKATLAQLTPDDIGAPTDAEFNTSVKSYVTEYAVNTSESTAPTTGWSTATPTRNPGDFIWVRTVVTKQDNSTSTTNPALLTGNTGEPGADGNDGAPGRGISSTAVTYQVSSSGTVAPNGTWQSTPQATSPGQYLWTRTIYTYTDATSDTAYSVAAHGATGSAGAAGRGITGTTVTYQKHTNGTTAPTGTWTSAIPATAPGEFLWTRTVTNYTDSTSSTAYSVAAHGEAGSDGADGVGISSTTVTYQTHSSGTVAPTGTWSATPTATVAGQFLWTRTITNYTDASSSTAYAVAAHGADGADGADGTDGRGISSTAVTYQVHTNGTTAPTGTWTSTVPSTTAGQFLWTRTVTTYTDASTTTAYSVAAHGATGSAGADGKGISSTAVTYQTHTNGTTAPTGAWSSTPTATSPGQFLWTRTVITYTDATNSTSYAVSAHGATGSAGAAGRGISNTVVNYAKNTDGTTAPASGWGTAIPATVAGEFLWTRTVTTYTDATTTTAYSVAAHGTSGADGNDGADGVGISGTTVTYQKHTSGTTAPTGTWTAGIPATVAGEFLWTRTVTNFTDATSTTAYSVAAHGAQGPQGNVGPTGKGISSSATTYQVHTSGTTAPTGTWLSSVPSVPAGQFLWTRTIITYTDAATSTAYSVAGAGTNGTNGVSVTAITRYWLRQTAGAGTPATPGNVATPGGAWTTTEPDYLAGTELWMMDQITYSNGTYAYTTPAKSSSYTAATTAITAANGKNKIIFSTGDATGTSGYVAGDLWYKRDGSGNIIATWEFTTTWQSRLYGDATLASLNVGKLVSGDISAALIRVTNTGAIQSSDYAAGSLGWKLDNDGLEINKGSVKASALIGDTLTSTTGKIQIGAGASIVLNGGFLRSNTYGGDAYNAGATAGWFLNDTNLHIPDGNISAKALKTGVISGTQTIELSGASAVIQSQGYTGAAGSGGFRLNGSGLSIPDGTLAAAKLLIQTGNNIVPPMYSDFEALAYEYKTGFGATNPSPAIYQVQGSILTDVTLGDSKFNTQSLGVLYGANSVNPIFYLGKSATDYNIPIDASQKYIFSAYVWCRGTVATNAQMRVKWSGGTTSLVQSVSLAASQTASGATRVQALLTPPAGTTGAVIYFESSTLTNQAGFNIDGIQVEPQTSYQTTASPWSPSSSTIINGGQIRTGEIRSTAYATKWDSATSAYVTDNTRPAFFINVLGAAEFNSLAVRGNMIVGDSTETPTMVDNGDGTFSQAPDGMRSTIASANYLPNQRGWILRSDGYAEFRNLLADSIDGLAIKANTLDVSVIKNESTLDKTIWVDGDLTARNTDVASPGYGSTVSLSGDGFYVKGANSLNNPVYVEFPTSGAPNIISGSLQASTLSVAQGATLRKENALELDAKFILNNQIGAPITVPSVQEYLPYATITGVSNVDTAYMQNMEFHDNKLWLGYYTYTTQAVNKVYAFTYPTGVYSHSVTLPNPNSPGPAPSLDGVVRIGSFWYARMWVASGQFKIYQFTDAWAYTGVSSPTITAYTESTTIGSDGTNVMVAGWNSATANTSARYLRWKFYSASTLAQVGTEVVANDDVPYVSDGRIYYPFVNGVWAGNFDYGANRVVISVDKGDGSAKTVMVFDSTGVRQTSHEWPLQLDTYYEKTLGFTVDRTNNRFIQLDDNMKFYEYNGGSGMMWTTESSTWYASYAWRRINGRTPLVPITSGSATISTSAGTFTTTDVGADVSGTGIQVDTRIATVSADGAIATLTKTATATTSTNLQISYETEQSPKATFTKTKRRLYKITGSTGPDNTVLRFYVGRGSTAPANTAMYLQGEGSAGIIARDFGVTNFSGNFAKAPGTFAAGSPAQIYSQQTDSLAVGGITITSGSKNLAPTTANTNPFFTFWVGATVTGPGIPADTKIATYNNMNSVTLTNAATATATNQTIYIVRPKVEIRGDGYTRISDLIGQNTILSSESDVTTTAGNKPALRIGDINGNHMRMDGNEIQSMADDDSAGTLILNQGGGNVQVGGTLTTEVDIRGTTTKIQGKVIRDWNWGVTTDTTNANGDMVINHGLGGTPDVVLVAGMSQEGLAGQFHMVWDRQATNFRVRCRNNSGAIQNGVSRTVAWLAVRN